MRESVWKNDVKTNHFLSDEIFNFSHQKMIANDDDVIDANGVRNLSQPER
jgi:hypothetical protein